MIGIVIAAHNEGAIIGRCLDALLSDPQRVESKIIVVANGCSDDTVQVASARRGVHIINQSAASKSAALNAGDELLGAFPRIYLDADIVVPPGGVAAVAAALADRDGPLAAVPGRKLDVCGRPFLVKSYFSINERLPAFREGIFGRGMIGLSSAGRARFDVFPAMVADDLFLDSLFTAAEKCSIAGVEVVVATPWRIRDLVRRLVRVRRGNAAMRSAGAAGTLSIAVRRADRTAWLRSVVVSEPRLLPAALAYVSITLVAAAVARYQRDDQSWGRDESTREEQAPFRFGDR